MTEVKDEKHVEIKQEQEEHVEEKEEKTETPEESKEETGIETRGRGPQLARPRTIGRFFDDMTRYMDEVFSRPFGGLFDYEPFSLRLFEEEPFLRTPLANISEDETKYEMKAEVPGLDKGDLEITIHDDMLEIKGENKVEHEEKNEEGQLVRREYSSSSYYRSFQLPEDVDEDSIDATLEKGILKLTLPKKELPEKEKKKIEVQ